MFSVFCAAHGSEILLTTRRIEAFHRGADGGIEIAWRCWCGQRGRSRTDPNDAADALPEAS